jgi:glycosyltransferase involved in cell wall biosynthesis
MSHTPGRPRAAVVTVDPYNQGGVRSMMSSVYRMLESRGFATELFYTLCDPPLPGRKSLMGLRSHRARRLDMDAYAMPSYPLPFWLWVMTPLIFGWRAIRQYDVHVSVCGSSHIALLPAVRRLPFVVWVATVYEDELRSKVAAGDAWARRVLNGPTWPILRAQERFAWRRASRILALSYYTARRIKELAPEVADRVETMLYPVDTGLFCPNPAARAESPHGEYLLFTARINDPRKNVALLLRAFAIVRRRFPNLKLVLAGDEPGEALLGLAQELGLGKSVVFAGLVEPGSEELLRLYQGAQLFVLPSTQEGLGIVVLEAMACGTPVVSTRCGGPEGIVSDGQTGRLVPNRDVEAFAGAVIDLLGQPDRLEAMRRACVAFAEQRFSWAAIERQLRAAVGAVFPEQVARVEGDSADLD